MIKLIGIKIEIKYLFVELDVVGEGGVLQNVDFPLLLFGGDVGAHKNGHFLHSFLHFFAVHHYLITLKYDQIYLSLI